MSNREALEDAFDRAEGQQEVAFRGYQVALKLSAKGKPNAAVLHLARGRRAHAALEQAALDLSTYRRDDDKEIA